MVWLGEILQQLLSACLQLIGQPFYYIGILFVILLYRRQMHLERKMFNSKLHTASYEVWKTLLWGVVAGFAASLFLAGFGAVLTKSLLGFIWIMTLLLICFRARFFCFAYVIGVVGILHVIVTLIPITTNVDLLDTVIRSLESLRLSSLLVILALVHLIEAIYIRFIGAKSAHPVILEGKRGRLVGGYQLQGFWPLPLFLFIPVDSGLGISLPWTPLFGFSSGAESWMLLAFPLVIGYSELTKTLLPQLKAKWSSNYLFLYSFLVALLAVAVEFWSFLGLFASVLCIVMHEAIVWYSAWKENQTRAWYVHDHRGLFVLGTISGSAAEELGILPGEIIRQVNGKLVKNRDELHQALNKSPAFCKLEVINREGHSKFLKRAIFANDLYMLGIVLAPDETSEYYLGMKHKSIWAYGKMSASGWFKKKKDQQIGM